MARGKCRRFMDQQMREFRVTSCWFGKTVEEVERRHFVKLKRCVLEPAARGFLAIARRCRLKKSIRQRFAFTLKDSADGLCDDLKPADSYIYLESAGTLLKDNQQALFCTDIAVVIWVYEIFRISGLLCVTDGLDPLEEQNLGTDQ
ncbi:hypothetical protein F511_10736 [Dorcoceras hygrometricum]|uniref:Uncharacterized protein n=1 Tax=Dorcoceras hygrometricum TaxID=472368 RepID=A0A2Z7CBL4_9LAMI|nr:hypothetical protein F511_10736 [Dorcoceras hygrometricum]